MECPKTNEEINAYVVLQNIVKMLSMEKSSYEPENSLRQRNIEELKKEYFNLIKDL